MVSCYTADGNDGNLSFMNKTKETLTLDSKGWNYHSNFCPMAEKKLTSTDDVYNPKGLSRQILYNKLIINGFN